MNSQIWGLWDCHELLSVHLTRADAHDARDEHIAACRCFTDDRELIRSAVEVRCMSVLDDRAPVENQGSPMVSVQDGTQTCSDRAARGLNQGGGSSANH